MDLSRPLAVITPTLDGEVLRILAQADAEFTSGDVHRLLNGPSMRGIQRTLERLSEQGIVSRRTAGRANLYRLNREHLAAPHVLALARQRTELLDRLSAQVSAWVHPPILGAIFGSAARDDHTASSDIDILLVRADDSDDDAWDQQTEVLAAQVTAWTGNDCRPITFTEAHITQHAHSEPLLADVVREGVVFHGDLHWLSLALKTKLRGRKARS